MKISNIKNWLLGALALIAIVPGYAQVDCAVNPPPLQGANLCRGPFTTTCTNTPSTITINYPNAYPPTSGQLYEVWVRYTNGDAPPVDCNEYIFANCSITSNNIGEVITINLPAGATLDDGVLDGAFKKFVNIRPMGAAGWHYFYHNTNNACSMVLPVTMTNFTVTRITVNGYTKVRLNWTTVYESNSSHFLLERSNNGAFPQMTIGQVAAAGSSYSTINYQYIDEYPSNSAINYYRIRSVDLDGKKQYSDIRYVNCNGYAVQTLAPANCSSISILGPDAFCGGGANYALSQAPHYTSYNWSLTPSGIGTLSTNLDQAFITKNYNGAATLQVNLSGCTAATATRTKAIQIGAPSSYVPVNTNEYRDNCNNRLTHTATVQMFPGTNGSHYQWYVNGYYDGTGSVRTFYLNQGQSVSYEVRYSNPCGNAVYYGYASNGGIIILDPVKATPNPANTSLQVHRPPPCPLEPALPRMKTAQELPMTAELYDLYGNLKKRVRAGAGADRLQIPTADLHEGIYMLKVTDQGKITTRQIKIVH